MMCEKWNNLLGIRITQCVKDYSIRTACWFLFRIEIEFGLRLKFELKLKFKFEIV